MKKHLLPILILLISFFYADVISAQISLPYNQNFESVSSATYTGSTSSITGLTGATFTTSTVGTTTGRLRTAAGTGFYHGGSRALTLDANPSGSVVTNYVVLPLDLSNYTSSNLELSFWFAHHGEESHTNDRIWARGSSSGAWVQIYDWYANKGGTGVYVYSGAIDVTGILAAASPSQVVSSTFQIRIGQQDNYPAATTTGSDGFSIDDIELVEVVNRDGSITAIEPFCAGLSSTKAKIKNLGANTLTSASISWSVNSISQPRVNVTGLSLVKGQEAIVTLGNYNYTGTTFSIQAQCDSINGNTDQLHANDTGRYTGASALSGVFTIGGTTPDFTDFSAARTALYAQGVCGPVTFNVRQGTYTEQLNFNAAISGASASNPIRFRSDPANSTIAKLRYNSDYTLNFEGNVGHIAFDSLKIETYGGANVVEMKGANHHISFNGVDFLGFNTASTSSSYHIIYLWNGQYTENLTVENCTSLYGSSFMYGYNSYTGYNTTATMMDSITIRNNVFEDFAYEGVHLRGYKNVSVLKNTIKQRSTGGYSYPNGVYLDYCDFIDVIGNNIELHLGSGGYSRGLYLNYCDGSTTNRNLVANNMVSKGSLASTSSGHSDYIYYCNYSDVVYNSWYGKTDYNSNAYGLVRLYYGTSVQFSNNSIVNDGGIGYAIRVYGTPTEKNNNYYNTATNTRYPVTGGTGNISVNPGYVSSTDLHILSPALDGKATPLALVTDDIDGGARHATTPDIGADEAFFLTNDAGIASFEMSPPCPGSNNVLVKLSNYGVSNLTSATVNWSVKAGTASPITQTPFSFTGNVGVGKDTIINIGSYSFSSGVNYALTAYSTVPNGVADQKPINDSGSTTVSTAMNGAYTIGGTTPDFTNFSAARTAIYNNGVCGPVTFNVRQGTYTERLDFNAPISGASVPNSIRFRPDPANTTVPKLRFNSDYTLRFGGNVGHIAFDSLEIETYGFANVVEMNGANHHISFNGVDFLGRNINSTSSAYHIFYLWNGQFTEHLTIENCTSQYGSSVVYGYNSYSGYSTTATMMDSIIIRNNEFKDYSYEGIHLRGYKNVSVLNNKLSNRTTGGTTNPAGIYLDYCDLIDVVGNQINLTHTNYSRGLYLNYCDGNATDRNLIANNMISKGAASSSSSSHSDYLYYCNYSDIVYNSWYGKTDYTSNSYGLVRLYNGTSVQFSNNSIVNDGGLGYAIRVYGTPTENTNNYFNSATNTRYPVSGGTGNLNVNPGYVSSADLHITTPTLNGQATPLAIVTDDIDSEARDATNPDIGADEAVFLTNDAGVVSFEIGLPCPGANNVLVKLSNFGVSPITTATINWSVKPGTGATSVQTPYSFTGNVGVGKDTIINIGSYSFTTGVSHSIIAYSTSPNGVTDQNPVNDTSSALLKTAMGGIFTIGGSSPDFTNFAAARTALNTNGVCAPVIFNVRQGTYTERLDFNAPIVGASAINTIRFRSDPANTTVPRLRYGSDYTLRFGGNVGHIAFDSLKIETYGYANVVEMNGANHHISFNGVDFLGINYNSTSTSYHIFYLWNGQFTEHLTIENCTSQYGASVIYGYNSYSGYNTTATMMDNIIIRNNDFKDFSYEGIHLRGYKNVSVLNNKIANRTTGGTTYPAGIYLDYCDLIDVVGNQINLTHTNYSRGLYLNYCDGNATDRNLIANNMISKGAASSSSSLHSDYLYYCNYSDVVYNSWYGKTNYNSSAYGLIRLYYGTSVQFSNNSIYNDGGGLGYAIRIYGTPVEKNNNYYNSNTTRRRYPVTGGTGNINVDPGYISTTDLHILTPSLNAKGTPLTIVTDDIDGGARNATTPDIGADEVLFLTNDAGIASFELSPPCPGSNNILVKLSNYGVAPITSATINWSIKAGSSAPVAQTAYSFTDTVDVGKDTILNIGSYSFVAGTSYVLSAYSTSPNGVTDQKPINDTSSTTFSTAMSGTYTIGGTTPDFTNFSAARTALYNDGVCGPVTFNVRQGTYTERLDFDAPVSGASMANSIRFRPDPANSTVPKLRFNSDYTLRFGGNVGHIAFDSLKIETYSYANVVEMKGANHHISFNGVDFLGINYSSTSTSYHIFYLWNGQFTEHLTIENCTSQYGASVVYGYNSYSGYNTTATMMDSIIIRNNEFKDFSYEGIHLRGYKNVSVLNNKISNRKTGGTAYTNGIYLDYCDLIDVVGNEVDLTHSNYSRGLYLNYCDGNASNRNLIANNMIAKGATASAAAAHSDYLYYCNYSDIVYNSWYGKTDYTSNSYGLVRLYNGTSIQFSNNSIFNDGGLGYAIRVYGTHTELNNNYYNTASNKRYPVSGGTGNISADPGYVSKSDLHSGGVGIYQKGTPLTIVTDDIDGDIRSSTIPSIGADEFFIAAIDASAENLEYELACTGLVPIQAKIANKGLSTLTSFNVNWSVAADGGSAVLQPVFIFNGSLAAGKDTVLTLGNINMNDTSSYSVLVYTFNPNGTADQKLGNDTTTRVIKTGISGSFTIGVNGDFANVGAAVSMLEAKGLCGDVILNLLSGTYTEQVTIENIEGTDIHNITLKAAATAVTKPILRYNSNYVIKVNDAKNITIDGIKIEAIGSHNVIELTGNNSNFQVSNCILDGYQSTSSSSSYAVIYEWNGVDHVSHNISILDNVILDGSYGIYVYGMSTSSYQDSLQIIGNEIRNWGYRGINNYYNENVIIDDNEIISRTSAYGSGASGIYSYYSHRATITNNVIVVDASSYCTGLYMNYCDGTIGNRALVANNMITKTRTSTSTSNSEYLYYCDYTDFVNNSWVTRHNANNSGYGAIRLYYGTSSQFSNNSIHNIGSNGYCINVVGSPTEKNNNYYNSVASRRRWPVTGGTANINVDPGYVSLTNGDLHVKTGALDSLGAVLSIVSTDIDGEMRDATDPDIGADEFDAAKDIKLTALRIDAGPCYSANDSVWFRFKNTGIYTLNFTTDSFKVDWNMAGSGIANGSVTVNSGVLAPGDEDSAFFAVNLFDTGSYNLESRVVAIYDGTLTNDTARTNTSVTRPNPPSYSGAVCYGDTLTLTGIGGTGSTFNWYSDSSLTNLIANGTTGEVGIITSDTSFYMTEVNGTYGCEGYAKKTLTIPDTLPTVFFSATSQVCETDSAVALSATPTGGVFSGNSVSNSIFNASTASSGANTLTYTYSNALGCENSNTSVVTVNVRPSVSVVFNNITSCTNGDGKITVTATGGTGTYSYSANGGVNYRSLNVFDSLGVGVYTVLVDDGICSVTEGTYLGTAPGAPPTPSVSGGGVYCKGSTLNAMSASFGTGGGSGTLKWYTDGTLSNQHTTGTTSNPLDSIGTIVYYVIEEFNGCKSSADTTSVVVNPLPIISTSALAARCNNENAVALSFGSPSGGVYSGVGVSNGSFNPTTAGAGFTAITYTYTDGNNCTDFDTIHTKVHVAPTVSLSALDSHCTNSPAYLLSGGSPAGGAYGGANVSGNTFNVSSAGAGLHSVFYKVSNANCQDSAFNMVKINTAPNATLPSISDRCVDAGALVLNGGSPMGGTYSGPGVSGTTFTPSVAGTGSHTIKYVYVDNNMCYDSTTVTTSVDALPIATFGTLSAICADASQISLTQGSASPTGGLGAYFGTAVSGTSFNPATSGVGAFSIGYAYTDLNGCKDTAYSTQTVNSLPIATFSSLSDVCVDASQFSMTQGSASPTGGTGTYFGTGINGSSFNPSTSGSGAFSIGFSYVDLNGCKDTAYSTQTVDSLPIATFGSLSDICVDASQVSLTQGSASPTGGTGTYFGTGVTGTSFNPVTSGSGVFSLGFSYVDLNGCKDTAYSAQTVDSLPLVAFGSLSNICANASQISLTQGSASPSGGTGTYFGSGVTGTSFNPVTSGNGAFSIGYAYVDLNGCIDTAYSTQTVDSVPVVTWTPSPVDVCIDAVPFAYSATPAGGVYSGNGILSSGLFSPTVAGKGTSTLRYVYTDANLCMDSVSNAQWVDTLPIVSLTVPANWCLNSSAITLTTGTPSGGSYNVNGVTATNYSTTTSGNDTIVYSYTDANNCMNTATSFITADTVPVVSFDTLADVCIGSAMIQLSQGKPAGGTYSGNNLSLGVYNPSVALTDTLNYEFQDNNGCADSANQTITVNALPVVSLGVITSVCENTGTHALNTGAPAGGIYSGNGVNGSSFDPVTAGVGVDTVTYTYTDGNNCTDLAKQSVEVYAAPIASLAAINDVCDNGDTVSLNMGLPAGGTYSGQGVVGAIFMPDTSVLGVNTITYIATNTNCSDTAMNTITVVPSPVFKITGDPEGCGKDPVVLGTDATPGFIHNWSTGDKGNTTSLSETKLVSVIVTDSTNALGCSAFDTIQVNFEAVCVGIDRGLTSSDILYFPNPNTGSFNYSIEGFEGVDAELRVISTSGQQVYYQSIEAMSSSESGTIRLEDVEQGVYFIYLTSDKGSAVHRIVINN